jgi:hypothetical protein
MVEVEMGEHDEVDGRRIEARGLHLPVQPSGEPVEVGAGLGAEAGVDQQSESSPHKGEGGEARVEGPSGSQRATMSGRSAIRVSGKE